MADEPVFDRDKRIRGAALTMGQTFYLVTLNGYIRNKSDAWPSQQTLANAMNATKRGVQKWQSELEAAGVLLVDVGCGRSSTNRYRLNLDALQPKTKGEHSAPLNDEHSAPFAKQMTNTVRPNDEHSSSEMTNTVRTERTVERAKKDHSVSEHFSEWYKIYPRKVGRPKAEAAYRKSVKVLTKRHQSQQAAAKWLDEVTSRFAASPAGQNGQYTPHPATWLNQGRYDDDPAEWTNGGTTTSASGTTKPKDKLAYLELPPDQLEDFVKKEMFS